MGNKYFHGKPSSRSFFEGWYLKHQSGEHTLSLIPSFHWDAQGNLSATLQIITCEGSWSTEYNAADCAVSSERFFLRMGGNTFTENGLSLNLEIEGLSIHGRLLYGAFTRLESDIMGPFRHLSFLQCNHGVLSLTHTLSGTLYINGSVRNYTGGTGYIEKDWGHSFPSSYLWTQCCWRHGQAPCSIMLSVADIPLFGPRFLNGASPHFTGCICSIYYGRQEIRLATYRGARIRRLARNEAVLSQHPWRLRVRLIKENPFPLLAPAAGSMNRTIHESPACTVRYELYRKSELFFDITNSLAGYEYSGGL